MRNEKKLIENDIETYMLNKAKANDALYFKFVSPQNSGVPDRILIMKGYVVFVELKKPGEKPRRLQVKIHERMRKKGAYVTVIDSKELVDELFDKLRTKRKRVTDI